MVPFCMLGGSIAVRESFLTTSEISYSPHFIFWTTNGRKRKPRMNDLGNSERTSHEVSLSAAFAMLCDLATSCFLSYRAKRLIHDVDASPAGRRCKLFFLHSCYSCCTAWLFINISSLHHAINLG